MADYVKLVSQDGHEVVIHREAAYLSRVLRGFFEAMSELDDGLGAPSGGEAPVEEQEMPTLPLEEINGKVLDLVCQYLSERLVSNATMGDFKPLQALDPTKDADRKLVLDLLLAADYLDC